MIKYKLAKDLLSGEICSVILTTEDGRIYGVPFDPDNMDFVEYQKWLSEGNSPLPADEPTLP